MYLDVPAFWSIHLDACHIQQPSSLGFERHCHSTSPLEYRKIQPALRDLNSRAPRIQLLLGTTVKLALK
jgi:hypothetical protein